MHDKETELYYSEEASAFIARKSFSSKYGARNMRRYIQTEVEDVIANRIISNYNQKINTIKIGVTDDGESLTFNYESAGGLMIK